MFVLQILYGYAHDCTQISSLSSYEYFSDKVGRMRDFKFIHNHKMTYVCTKRAGRFFNISSMRAFL